MKPNSCVPTRAEESPRRYQDEKGARKNTDSSQLMHVSSIRRDCIYSLRIISLIETVGFVPMFQREI